MKELRAILDAWHTAGGQPMVLATVVETHGSTYRHAGARMLLLGSPAGVTWVAGSISGGCLEGDLMESAWRKTEDGPGLVTYDSTSEQDIVWGFGLGCNGVVRVLLERLHADDPQLGLLRDFVETGRPCQVVTCISEGPDLGRRVVSEADELVSSRAKVEDREGTRYLVEAIASPLRLVIFGGGHDVPPLTRFASELGWHVTVVDHRPAYATRERFPSADEVLLSRGTDGVAVDANTYAVVMTHNYAQDLAVLGNLIPSEVAYIGLLGPAARKTRLLQELGSPDTGGRLFGPVGLDIGAEGPDEIALAIIAEVQAVRSRQSAEFLRQKSEILAPSGRGGFAMRFGVVVLAAGGSSRMGLPKQFLPYGDTTLLGHAVDEAIGSGADEVIVVTGEHGDRAREVLAGKAVRIVVNEDWQSGMASSLRTGIGALDGELESAIVTLADQPHVTAAHLGSLAQRQVRTQAPIVASGYSGILGVPAIFARGEFGALQALTGDAGARELIRGSSTEFIDFPPANKDIDTVEDLRQV